MKNCVYMKKEFTDENLYQVNKTELIIYNN